MAKKLPPKTKKPPPGSKKMPGGQDHGGTTTSKPKPHGDSKPKKVISGAGQKRKSSPETWGPADATGVTHATGNMTLAQGALHKSAAQRTDAEKMAVKSTRADRAKGKKAKDRTPKEQAALVASRPKQAAELTPNPAQLQAKQDALEAIAGRPQPDPGGKPFDDSEPTDSTGGSSSFSFSDWHNPMGHTPGTNPWTNHNPGTPTPPHPVRVPRFSQPHVGSNQSQVSANTRQILLERFRKRMPGGTRL